MTQDKREIVFDSETTGFSPENGDRIVELGCVEVVNFVPTGREFHVYINPERMVPQEAVNVHGLTSDFLKDKPKFADIVDDFLAFVGGARMIAHNASFDMKFVNAELKKLGRPALANEVTDTLIVARKKLPHKSVHTLDALLNHFKINKSARDDGHGALLDSHLLAKVWLELNGGANYSMDLPAEDQKPAATKPRPKLSRKLLKSPSAKPASPSPTTKTPERAEPDHPGQATTAKDRIPGLLVIKPSETETCDNRAFREANGFPERG